MTEQALPAVGRRARATHAVSLCREADTEASEILRTTLRQVRDIVLERGQNLLLRARSVVHCFYVVDGSGKTLTGTSARHLHRGSTVSVSQSEGVHIIAESRLRLIVVTTPASDRVLTTAAKLNEDDASVPAAGQALTRQIIPGIGRVALDRIILQPGARRILHATAAHASVLCLLHGGADLACRTRRNTTLAEGDFALAQRPSVLTAGVNGCQALLITVHRAPEALTTTAGEPHPGNPHTGTPPDGTPCA